jgi:hypothetical protein
VAYLQEWAEKRFTAIAIVSEDTIDRYKGCLPSADTAAVGEGATSVPLPLRKPPSKSERRASLP